MPLVLLPHKILLGQVVVVVELQVLALLAQGLLAEQVGIPISKVLRKVTH